MYHQPSGPVETMETNGLVQGLAVCGWSPPGPGLDLAGPSTALSQRALGLCSERLLLPHVQPLPAVPAWGM